MVLGVIALGAIGAAYVTGDSLRKQKMRKVGSDCVEIATDTAVDVFDKSKELFEKIKGKVGEGKQGWSY